MSEKEREALLLYEQIKALRVEVEKVRPEDADRKGCPGSGITAFILPFNHILKNAESVLSDDSLALKQLENTTTAVSDIQEEFNASFHKIAKHQILMGCGAIIAILEQKLAASVQVPSMKLTREGVFFSDQQFSAIQRATDILLAAKSTIMIVDGYVDHSVLGLLEGKQPRVEVRLLTKTVSGPLRVAAEAFNKQYSGLSIRISDIFHDRFIVVDDTEFYHFGASLKDLGRRGFMYSRIEEPVVIELLRQKFTEEWDKATPVI